MLQIDMDDTAVVGESTPDPLRYAFLKKKGAHAGGSMMMLPQDEVQSSLMSAMSTQDSQHTPRCLYIHIPFCRVRCTYCNFFQYASSRKLIDEYFAALVEEIKWKAAMPWSQSAPFQAVYVGGGTPTDLSAQQIRELGQLLHQYFPLTPDCEITLEGRVNGFSVEKFEHALEGGFSRFSFGVQSFNTQVRRKAKRLNDKEEVIEHLQTLHSYNSAPIVVDLLYGLPYQTLDVWQQDLHDYLETGVDGVDLYQLIEMPNLPMYRMIEQGKLPDPADTPTKAQMFEMGVKFMDEHFQRRLSVNHWAANNRERSIYNSIAKTTAQILPLGAGAGGNVGGLSMMQIRDMDAYISAIKNKQFATMGVMRSSAQAPISNAIKAGFDKGVLSAKTLNQEAGCELFSLLMPLFEKWQHNGLVNVNPQYLSLTLAGQFWATTLAQNTIQVIQQNNNHISKAA